MMQGKRLEWAEKTRGFPNADNPLTLPNDFLIDGDNHIIAGFGSTRPTSFQDDLDKDSTGR